MAGTEALNIVITAENSDVIRKIEEIVRAISGVQGKSITLNADSSKVTEAVNEANSKIDNVSGKEISLRADGSQAEQEIAGVSASMQAVNDTEANISVSGAGEAVAKADEVSSAMAGVSGVDAEINIENSQALGAVEQVADAQEAIKDAHSEFTADGSQAINEAGKVSEAQKNLKDAHINITADSSQALGETEKISDAEKSLNDSHIEITADGSQAVQEAEKVSDATKNVNDTHVEITADGSQAIDEAGRVANAEQNIQGVHSEITANGAQAIGEAGAVQSVLDGVTDKEAKVTVDTSQAESAAGQAKAALDGVTDKEVKVTADDSQIEDAKRKFEQFIAEFNGKKVTFTVTAGKAQVFKDIYGRLYDIHGNIVSIGRKAGEGFAKEFSSAANNGINSVKEQFNALLAMNVGEKISASFGAAFSTITSMLQKVANTISGVMRSALSVGGGFEAQMTTVKVISGATEEELDKLTKKAREMGATLPITAKDAATAMTYLVQRGTSAADTLATVDSVANLAIAQSTNMGEVAELLGTAMSSFSIDIGEAAKVTAVFNNACNQSPLSMQRLMAAFKYAAPAAGSLGISITEAVSAMEAISRVLPSGEMTGTGYAMVLSKIAAKSEIAGVKTHNLDGSLRSVKDIFLDLKKAQASYAELNKVFGQRGVKAALALQQNAEALEEYEARLKNYGTTQGAVDEKAKTFTNTMAALRSAIEEFHIEIFDQIKDKSKETVGGITALARAFSDWVKNTQIAGKALNAFLEGLGFKIPSADDFKKFLDEIDVQAFVDKVKDFGESLRDIGDKILGAVDKIKTPLLWLIEHLDTFTTISFWGWITGKALQVPAAIMGIAFAFKELYATGQLLLGLSWAKLAPLMAVAPYAAAVVAGLGTLAYSANKMSTAKAELKDALDKEKQYLAEQANADLTLPFDIKFNLKTGFEKLPESWTKASDQVRAEANETVKVIQEQFRGKVAEAVEFVAGKFPEMSAALAELADSNDVIMARISAALHGSEQDFEALPEFYRKVVERINALDLGVDKIGNEFAAISQKYVELKQEIEKPVKVDEGTAFLEDISANIRAITAELPTEIERANKFLNGSEGQLSVQVSLAQAQKKLEAFTKSAAEKYNLPQDIVKSALLERLNELALTGDETAQSLINGFGGVRASLGVFLTNAQEAINYLGASPDKFMPALNSMMKGIQRIDPLTGKVTEQFKKAHDALKQWSNVTFDQLASRIQRLRRAVEGGFVDQSALEAEFKRVLPQLKLQVVNDIQSQREQYRTENDFQAVIASELIARIADLFGDVGINMARDNFNGQTGIEMGRSILAEIERGMGNYSDTFTIDGVDQFTQGLGSIASLPQNIADAVSPYVMRLEQLNPIQSGTIQASTASPVQVSATPANPASDFSSLTVEFQKLIVAIDGAKSFIEGNTSALKAVSEGVLRLVNSAGNSSQGVSYTTVKDYSADIASVVKAMQDFSTANIQAVNLVEAAIRAQQQSISLEGSSYTANSQEHSTYNQDLSSVLAPLLTELQNIHSALNPSMPAESDTLTQNLDLYAVINAVNAVESAIKSQQQTSNSEAVIVQAIASVFAPFLTRLEQSGNLYQSSSAAMSRDIQALGGNIDALRKSADSNISALTQLQSAINSGSSSGESQNFSAALTPLMGVVQNLLATLNVIQGIQQTNANSVNEVLDAVRSTENALKSMSAGNTYDIDIIQQGFNVASKADADYTARSAISALRSGLGNGGI